MIDLHEIAEGQQTQTPGEQIAYSVDTTKWGGDLANPTNPAVAVFDESNGDLDVTATVMPTASGITVSGAKLMVPELKSLTAGHLYRVRLRFKIDGNQLEAFMRVLGMANP